MRDRLPAIWAAVYRQLSDAELQARAAAAGYIWVENVKFAGMPNSTGWKKGNTFSHVKKGGDRFGSFRAKIIPHVGRNDSVCLNLEHDLDCSSCASPIIFQSSNNDTLLNNKRCWTCQIWHETLEVKTVYACDNNHGLGCYEPGSPFYSKNGSWLGFGGAVVSIIKPTGEIISGNNLWHRGDIHERFYPLVKNFAVLRWVTPDKINPTELALIAAISGAKGTGDYLPLLIYADWLDEHGESPIVANAFRNLVPHPRVTGV